VVFHFWHKNFMDAQQKIEELTSKLKEAEEREAKVF